MVDNKIIVYPSYYLIRNVDNVPYDIMKTLGVYNRYHALETIGYYYNKKLKELRIPRGYSRNSLEHIFNDRVFEYYDKTNINRNSNIDLLNGPRDYIQEQSLSFMLGQPPFEFTRNSTQLYSNLDTGDGKTYLGIASICFYKTKAVIITPPTKKVSDQWENSIFKFTTLKRPDFLNVSGSKVCEDIIEGKYPNVKIFMISRTAILAFVKKYNDDWRVVTELFDRMDVSIKIIDEAHVTFETIVKIDCFSNVPKTYYMSSTPSRSDHDEKSVYFRVFNDVHKFGKNLKSKEQKHIIPLILFFKSTPTSKQISDVKTPYGTSMVKYGDYILDENGAYYEFIDAYTYALYLLQTYKRRNGKILVLCPSIDFGTRLQAITKTIFPYLSSGLFVGSGKEKNKELDNDIIFSTINSMGTGSEIENHQLTINTITYASEVLADQIPGRIRKQTDRKGIYCEIVNMNHPTARKQYDKREKHLINKAKDGKIIKHEITVSDISSLNKFFANKYRISSNGLTLNSSGNVIIHKNQ